MILTLPGCEERSSPLIKTSEFSFVTIVIPPVNVNVPILSIWGILSTSPLLPQLRGGTKNIPWLASLVVPPIPW